MATLPPLVYETLHWTPSLDYSYTRSSRRGGPYRAAIPPAIADLHLELPSDVNAAAEDASLAITRFDAELGGEIAPFSAVLLRSESAASSRIENLTASARSIAEAELPGARGKANAEQIVANTAAMTAAVELSDRVDADAILAMHAALMTGQSRHTPGRWRTEPVWIGGGNTPLDAMFVPPRHERIPAAIDDLIAFAARDDVALLAQIAVAHAQFETIHPFTDGNGRTGRALAQSMLRNKGLARQVTVPVSAGLLADTDGYFAALTAYREGDLAPIVERFAHASERAVANGRQLITQLRDIRASWDDLITARSDSAVWRVADLLTRRPVVNGVLLREELGIPTDHPRRYMGPLTEAGIVVEFTDRARNRAWRAPEILDALDDFAERAGRRG
ncbi:Fic family protein [Mycolicibacterium fortuitum]|uniref:Fic family protein n=2 Tax=Mycolicibacterium fortuitum TaxID=1766 RepID=A0AAE4VCK1_MYCFO|nr:Fic family protein [Mycolicibacterium fortuitum]MCA4727265.1 Fic family protein [Mycolicibacterium fortuitum]MCV7139372.1 Fic family protein [Mycolicibacterium fortuitum]MDV7191554.1 Fic family protein [Mycolicibacterium fortuitum]MDV7204676.1 Fic family protein [Mycolicibacterium fortuitum]MDV7225657.1 Fic family protein [Mycolicibacterium fortuitum]